MAVSMPISVFIPQEIICKITNFSFAFGYWTALKNTIVVNFTTVVEAGSDEYTKLCGFVKASVPSEQYSGFQFLGIVYSSAAEEQFDIEDCEIFASIQLKIRINEPFRSFHLEKVFVRNCNVTDKQVVIYDGYSITKSQLLPLTKQTERSIDFFISFLILTCNNFMDITCDIVQYNSCAIQDSTLSLYSDGTFLQCISSFMFLISWILSKFYTFSSSVLKWCPQILTNILLWTALGQQFHQRYLHFSALCCDQLGRKPLSVKSKNLICALIVDVLFGCLLLRVLLKTDISNVMLEAAMSSTNDIVNSLTNLINWLMGAPAGLKLNIPLNNALGKFFLYHIYLWECVPLVLCNNMLRLLTILPMALNIHSYMTIVQPVFVFIFKISTGIGIFGLTFILSLLNDLISLATIHIYCFYGYAARLYGYQVKSLSALWRLFRGKKWNPLRQRIDSYTYDAHQLYLGTLIFTVLLFLLPTVMVYYFVFTCLRILVLVIQGVLSRVINILTVCPIYSIISRILNSAETAGDVYFSVFNTEGALTLSMQASQISLTDVIQLTVPDLSKYHELLTWREIMSCIVWGKIIYPL